MNPLKLSLKKLLKLSDPVNTVTKLMHFKMLHLKFYFQSTVRHQLVQEDVSSCFWWNFFVSFIACQLWAEKAHSHPELTLADDGG